jgi:hypothetical protein
MERAVGEEGGLRRGFAAGAWPPGRFPASGRLGTIDATPRSGRPAPAPKPASAAVAARLGGEEVCRGHRHAPQGGDPCPPPPARAAPPRHGGHPRRHPATWVPWLVRVREVSDRLCGRLLVAVLPLCSTPSTGTRALRVPRGPAAPPVTADRSLCAARSGAGAAAPAARRGRPARGPRPHPHLGRVGHRRPGEVQVDLVGDCGESTAGFFLTTLVALDVATGWTELEPICGPARAASGRRLRASLAACPSPCATGTRTTAASSRTPPCSPVAGSRASRSAAAAAIARATRPSVEGRNWPAVRRVIGRDRYCLAGRLRALRAPLRPAPAAAGANRHPMRKLVATRRIGRARTMPVTAPRPPRSASCPHPDDLVGPAPSSRVAPSMPRLTPDSGNLGLEASLPRSAASVSRHHAREQAEGPGPGPGERDPAGLAERRGYPIAAGAGGAGPGAAVARARPSLGEEGRTTAGSCAMAMIRRSPGETAGVAADHG